MPATREDGESQVVTVAILREQVDRILKEIECFNDRVRKIEMDIVLIKQSVDEWQSFKKAVIGYGLGLIVILVVCLAALAEYISKANGG